MTANGMGASLLALRADAEGFGATVVGLLGTVYFAGLLAGASIGGDRIRAVGYIRSFAGLIAVATVTVLSQLLATDQVVWLVARAVYGVCVGGLLVVIESWLNRASDPATRGRTMARYLVATTVGWVAGQVLLSGVGFNSFEPFVVVALLLSLAAVPVLLARTPEPRAQATASLRVRQLAGRAPSAVAASAVAGACWGAVGAVGAVYAQGLGLGSGGVAAFVAAFFVGQALSAGPLGHLSDRRDRRVVASAMAAGGAAVAAMGVVAGDSLAVVLALAVTFGALVFPMYGFAIAIAADAMGEDEVTGAAGALVRVNGLSAAVAPIAVTTLQRALEPAFFVVLGAVCGAAALVMAASVRSSGPRLPTVRLRVIPARTSVVLGEALTRVAGSRRRASVDRP